MYKFIVIQGGFSILLSFISSQTKIKAWFEGYLQCYTSKNKKIYYPQGPLTIKKIASSKKSQLK